ncbi:hypothetical protein GSI_10930 [Ganoderma sinense ZZ0214-1]|uniref:DUF4336 domain-containing protein n=1 Tax=Ganoderma sinense ZZ0214-1 TaxID=1077348 RepID=A0A2G8S216_9APHY|nr:hypothetical protein GSI_10930 [Ganoderma sinense ZZ0214-1]
MSDIVIREVTQNVWTFSRPFTLLGFAPVGGRSTAIKLQSGDVWILASTPLTDETKQKLADLGDVKYIIAGNAFHYLFVKDYKEAYPNAKVIGPEDLPKKKKLEFTLDGEYSAANPDAKFGYEDEIIGCHFTGFANRDIAFLHKPSRTVIAADLLFNNPPHEQYSKSTESPKSLLFSGLIPTGLSMRLFLMAKQDNKAEMIRDAKTVASWDFDRYIPCHGDVIETGASAAWRSAWRNYLA